MSGHIFERANSNTYYLRYVINGKVMQQALYDDKGEAITTAKDAEQALLFLPIAPPPRNRL